MIRSGFLKRASLSGTGIYWKIECKDNVIIVKLNKYISFHLGMRLTITQIKWAIASCLSNSVLFFIVIVNEGNTAIFTGKLPSRASLDVENCIFRAFGNIYPHIKIVTSSN
jgi:hypothetical protein